MSKKQSSITAGGTALSRAIESAMPEGGRDADRQGGGGLRPRRSGARGLRLKSNSPENRSPFFISRHIVFPVALLDSSD
jgi:hypothetical protein